jgi:pyrimidine-nucleoside phosphorylase
MKTTLAARAATTRPVTPQGTLAALAHGERLPKPHIDEFVAQTVTKGALTEAQIGAFLMGVRTQGMSPQETTWLTQAMANSGDKLDLSGVTARTVDKHSTGGISDGTSFLVSAIVASFGLAVPMMSGRGLGHTGGTLDKLEAIEGFRVALDQTEIVDILNAVGLAIFAATDEIAPADAVYYGIRSETSTVDSIALIAASIMSKKLAAGPSGLVLNVTTGTGAFMKDEDQARELAEAMVGIALDSGLQASSVISRMDQPLAPFVGNALEIQQAIRLLSGEQVPRTERFVEVSVALATEALIHGGMFTVDQREAAEQAVKERLTSGEALGKFRDMVTAQGGDARVVDDLTLLPQADRVVEIRAPRAGYISSINSEDVGWAAVYLGGGREAASDTIDPAVGIEVVGFLGDQVQEGDIIARLYVNDETRLEEATQKLLAAYKFGDDPVEVPDQIVDRVTQETLGRPG